MKQYYQLSLLIFINFSAISQQQYALLVAIDEYAPLSVSIITNTNGRNEWPDLEGCKNDALSVKNEIVARWGFINNNIRELYNREATRQNILTAIDELLQKSKNGDVAFIYYAGHGSQVRNSRSAESDKLDESIVPADAWKAGVEDIRDKTLADRMNRFVDKGVLLTVIYDCCNSGSMGKGFPDQLPKFRYMKRSNYDAMDGSNPPAPESRQKYNYLALFAAQENEPAQEQKDDNNTVHGAFTFAFLQAMNQQGVHASVTNIFSATRAILKSNGKKQEPVVTGIPERQQATLFGLKEGALQNKVIIPLLSVGDSLLEFQGGYLLGLNADNELTRLNGAEKVKITKMMGANRCLGKLIAGNITSLKAGQLFEVSNWVSQSAPFLKVYMPGSNLTKQQVDEIAKICLEIKQAVAVKWVSSLQEQDPDIIIYRARDGWMANDALKESSVPIEFSARSINSLAKGRYVFINIPSPKTLEDSLRNMFTGLNKIELVNDPNNAQYYLAGSLNNRNELCYGLVRSQTQVKDSLETMPVQTLFGLPAKGIFEYALRLSKIRAWLNLKAPHQTDSFPFHLQLRDYLSEQPVSNHVKVGQRISIRLVTSEGATGRWDKRKRFIYVFVINNQGKISAIFPENYSGNQDNQFPADGKNNTLIIEKTIVEWRKITEPAGTDTYFLLATEDPIPNFNFVLEQEGVGGKDIASSNSLEQLLKFANPKAKESAKPVPAIWNLERIAIKTIH